MKEKLKNISLYLDDKEEQRRFLTEKEKKQFLTELLEEIFDAGTRYGINSYVATEWAEKPTAPDFKEIIKNYL